jgi:hypothetical protein
MKPKRKNDENNMNLESLPMFRATIEAMKTPSFIESVKSAEIILTYPTSPEWNPQIAYGTQTLQRIVSSGIASMACTLCLVIDWTSEEPEHLIAVLRAIKGNCDIQ